MGPSETLCEGVYWMGGWVYEVYVKIYGARKMWIDVGPSETLCEGVYGIKCDSDGEDHVEPRKPTFNEVCMKNMVDEVEWS